MSISAADLATLQTKIATLTTDKAAADAATSAGNDAATALATAQAAVNAATTAETAADAQVTADLADLKSFVDGLSAS